MHKEINGTWEQSHHNRLLVSHSKNAQLLMGLFIFVVWWYHYLILITDLHSARGPYLWSFIYSSWYNNVTYYFQISVVLGEVQSNGPCLPRWIPHSSWCSHLLHSRSCTALCLFYTFYNTWICLTFESDVLLVQYIEMLVKDL